MSTISNTYLYNGLNSINYDTLKHCNLKLWPELWRSLYQATNKQPEWAAKQIIVHKSSLATEHQLSTYGMGKHQAADPRLIQGGVSTEALQSPVISSNFSAIAVGRLCIGLFSK